MSEHPLIDALSERHGIPVMEATEVQHFATFWPATALAILGDPRRHPEAVDLAVILPELLRAFDGRLSAARARDMDLEVLKARYGFIALPCLVLLSPEGYLGRIERLRDWTVYLAEIERLLAAPAGRVPGIGVPIAQAAGQAPAGACG
jgi:hydrogenase-1 operon protein HyaE